MTKLVTVDVTYRIKIEMAEDDDINEMLHNMDADFAWPDGEAAVTSQEIMDQEVVGIRLI